MPTSLATLLNLLRTDATGYEPGEETLTLKQIFTFTTLTHSLRGTILDAQRARDDPSLAPEFIPTSVLYYLSEACAITLDQVQQLWDTFCDDIWNDAVQPTETETLFKVFGNKADISASSRYTIDKVLINSQSFTLVPSTISALPKWNL